MRPYLHCRLRVRDIRHAGLGQQDDALAQPAGEAHHVAVTGRAAHGDFGERGLQGALHQLRVFWQLISVRHIQGSAAAREGRSPGDVTAHKFLGHPLQECSAGSNFTNLDLQTQPLLEAEECTSSGKGLKLTLRMSRAG